MPQLVKKRRSGWAVLAAGAMVASLLAVAASPVGAEIDKADHTASASACVGDALGDQMYTDVSDEHAFADHINCIAYYGVTNGTGDGSTFSPNDDVTRAQMAVFIARAAGVAGVDLGDAMDEGFTDIDDIWAEAQDAINQLASKGIIDGGGAFRPDDDITRAEMASFLIGLLAKASPSVTIDSAGAIQLGDGATTMVADDHFGDVRATQTRAVDAETAALYELGITKGASAASGAKDGEAPLDYNYEPDGSVDRGEMAAFITRALAHTSVRPEGVSAQHDGTSVVISVRDENFAPKANIVVDVFKIDTAGIDLAFQGDGSCGEVDKVSDSGSHLCEIDGTDAITRGDGDVSVPLGDIDTGGTTVWVWTGDMGDTVDEDTDPFQLDVAEGDAAASEATLARVSTEFTADKAHLGSSVLYTVQLEDANGAVTGGTPDAEKPAEYLVVLSTTAMVDTDPGDGVTLAPNPQGPSVVSTLPLPTDDEGKATFPVSGLPDQAPDAKIDKYQVKIEIQARPGGNAPADIHIGDAADKTDPEANGRVLVGTVTFSTEASSRAAGSVSVEPAAKYIVADARGASSRVTVTVTDQYGDPISGAEVSLASAGAGAITIPGPRAVGRDGSYTFSYMRESADAAAEMLTATWDPDGDDTTSNNITGTTTVEWAVAASSAANGLIQEFDTETNTIFAGATGATVVVTYDSNDRFNVGATGSIAPSTYAGFEKALAKGLNLSWLEISSGRRAVNVFTLTTGS